jgi:uncharacterized protein YfaT (DUF1175 family)
MPVTSAAIDHCQAAVQNQGAMGRSDRTRATTMLRIMIVAAAALVALALGAGRPVRAEDDCDAVTKHALREFKTTLDQHKERWVELQGTANESDPPIMQAREKKRPPVPIDCGVLAHGRG